ncbi:ABC transporter ATP-binding protein [Sulfobacillus harzensis]|uniref:ABC transporter ATP-binding protein n=1 Tax=Sulfobacillus harzensis TaxID=2729629 RepID=A0A7Y0Q397_9FIRM|nr:ABC transporter ATP-binding protein [Sulfobacillus harzensis]NMP22741.1 ABC transporter ATP-binding protein [Sulfobacillus harzensis]
MLAIEHVSASYGRGDVLEDVSLVVGPGEIVALLGPNGAGKTSLFRAVAGLIRARSGHVRFKGAAIEALPPWKIARLGIGFVPEGRQLVNSLSARDNARLLISYGTTKQPAEREAAINRALALFPQLKGLEDRTVGSMSGGQQQMVAMARALSGDPELLLLDEPSLGLAPLTVKEVYRAIEAYKSSGHGILLIEQHATVALSVADRVYVMNHGKVVAHERAENIDREGDLWNVYMGQKG